MDQDIIVIGAGPAGLAVAGALAMRGRRAVVLERSADVGSSWRGHYDRLRLHTTRRLSGLPGLPIPRSYGRWVARADLVRYLESYRAHFDIDVRTGVEVTGIAPVVGGGWMVRDASGAEWQAANVVVAAGYNHTRTLPSWPGQDGFTGSIVHAGDYRNPGPYADRSVLVVGTGNTGCEIAQDLGANGAAPVWLAYRTVPNIVRREKAGIPAQWTGIAVRHLPPRLVDRVGALMARSEIPDLTAYGLPRATAGLYSRVLDGAIPVQDVGIIDAIRARRVLPVPTLERFDGADVVLVDGRRLTPDVVLVATGFTTGLASLVGDLVALDARGRPRVLGGKPAAPGMYFLGYTNPISGMLREIAIDARKIAKAIAG